MACKGEKERIGSIAEFIKGKRESQLLEKSMGRNNKTLRSPAGEGKVEGDKRLGTEKEGGMWSRRVKFQKGKGGERKAHDGMAAGNKKGGGKGR